MRIFIPPYIVIHSPRYNTLWVWWTLPNPLHFVASIVVCCQLSPIFFTIAAIKHPLQEEHWEVDFSAIDIVSPMSSQTHWVTIISPKSQCSSKWAIKLLYAGWFAFMHWLLLSCFFRLCCATTPACSATLFTCCHLLRPKSKRSVAILQRVQWDSINFVNGGMIMPHGKRKSYIHFFLLQCFNSE